MSQAHFESLPQRYKLRSVITPRRLAIPLTRHGRNFVTQCPLHDSANATMFFFKSLGYWEYKCVECGIGGDLIDYVANMQYSHLPSDKAAQAAFEFWMESLSASELEALNEEPEGPAWMQSGYFERTKVLNSFVQYCVWSLSSNTRAQEILQSRGWSVYESRLYGLGFYNAEIDPFLDYCALNEIDQSLIPFYLDKINAVKNSCFTLPVRNAKGQIYTVLGIEIEDESISNSNFAFSSVAGDVPFNISNKAKSPILVPHIFDALTADLMGLQGVVSVFSDKINPGHLFKLQAGGAESITLVIDKHSFNQENQHEKLLQVANEHGLAYKSIVLPEGYTVESFLRDKGKEEFEKWVESFAPDNSKARRQTVLMQEILKNFELNMSREKTNFNLVFSQFEGINNLLGGVKPAYYLILSDQFVDKTCFLSNIALDLLKNNSVKLIYLSLDAPRQYIINYFVALKASLPIEDVQYNTDPEKSHRIFAATKDLAELVSSDSLEIIDASQITDDASLLKILRSEVAENPNILLCVDGFYRLAINNSKFKMGGYENSSALLLELQRSLNIPMICAGELWSEEAIPGYAARDPDYVLRLTSSASQLNLFVMKDRGNCQENLRSMNFTKSDSDCGLVEV
ncbi:MAG: hypothetical protein GX801_08875 [Fibrobacter sp.]|nr:hypothetical protein [Fibrobacter sp.]